jgi:hypothetical protein
VTFLDIDESSVITDKVAAVPLGDVMDQLHAEGWTRTMVCEVAIEYRRYLILRAAHSEFLPPPPFIARFWMQHVLNTEHYRNMCDNVFGCFFDHSPAYRFDGTDIMRTVEVFENWFPNRRLTYWLATDFEDLRY